MKQVATGKAHSDKLLSSLAHKPFPQLPNIVNSLNKALTICFILSWRDQSKLKIRVMVEDWRYSKARQKYDYTGMVHDT